MTEPIVSGTYGTLSGGSQEALEPRGRSLRDIRARDLRAADNAITSAGVRASHRGDASARLRRSNVAQASALLASSAGLQPSPGGPIVGGECIGLVLSTATKFLVGPAGADRSAA